MPSCSNLSLFISLLVSFFLPAASAVEEGVRERWGELHLVLREPVVSRTVVENAELRAQAEALAASATEAGEPVSPRPALPSAADCGLELFTVAGSPAPKLRWSDQNVLKIEFAPGTSPNTEYQLEFKPTTTYLGGAALATRSFRFRCKPVELGGQMLPEHAGGVALLSAAHANTAEALRFAENSAGLRVTFRRMRHLPLLGWVCMGTVPAVLEPATVEQGLCPGIRRAVLQALLRCHKPESIRPETLLPQCLLVRPLKPLVPGARYELGIEAPSGSGFASGYVAVGDAPMPLRLSLHSELVVPEGKPGALPTTRLTLRADRPVPELQLRALWEQVRIAALRGEADPLPAVRQPDGSYRLELEGAPALLRLRRILPCAEERMIYRPSGSDTKYVFSPPGCAMGLEMEVESPRMLELEFSLSPQLSTRHGLGMEQSPLQLRAAVMPACPALTGNGCNEVALSGSHLLRLPCINLQGVKATAYHWEAEAAARLLPLIHRSMRDDTAATDLLLRLNYLRRRSAEGLETEGWRDDMRTEAVRALRLLAEEREWQEPLRRRALGQASVYPLSELTLQPREGKGELVQRGEVLLDLDQLTCGTLRPGLYLISLTCEPSAEVGRAFAHYQQQPEQEAESPTCTVDYLVQVTDIHPQLVADRLLVNSLATGEVLKGVQACAYDLPQVAGRKRELKEGGEEIQAEAQPLCTRKGQPEEPRPMPQGALPLPVNWEGELVLLRRGEDYCLLSLAGERAPWRESGGGKAGAVEVEMFCDRPLYRPGDVAHLRGMLRGTKKGGLSLPRAREVELTFHKPNGEVMENRRVPLDAFGAFSADFTLPAGEEDVAGAYRCELRVQEGGKTVEYTLMLRSEVFRRDAFTVEMNVEVDPVAPKSCSVRLQATDYNGSPVAGGKVRLTLISDVALREEGQEPPVAAGGEAARRQLTRELVLDAEGRASWQGGFDPFEKGGQFTASAEVANDREEYVKVEPESKVFSSADFLISTESGQRLQLLDARTQEPLTRAQELHLRLTRLEDSRRALPSGLCRLEPERRELVNRRITVPAGGIMELREALGEGSEQYSWQHGLKLELAGHDAAGRCIRYESELFMRLSDSVPGARNVSFTPAGRKLTLECKSPLASTPGWQHVLIHSQGRLRHMPVWVEAGARSLTLPLTAQEYGDVAITLVLCSQDTWGTFRQCQTHTGSCSVPRPDKELQVQLTLPQGARPGQVVSISGQVRDAAGKPVKAALTLFAVDAGMMSVAPYTLPNLAVAFYEGEACTFESRGQRLGICCPKLVVMPDIWNPGGISWEQGLAAADGRSVSPHGLRTEALGYGLGSLCRGDMASVVRIAQPNFRWSDLFDFAEVQYAPTPAMPCVEMEESLSDGGAAYGAAKPGGGFRHAKAKASLRTRMMAAVDSLWEEKIEISEAAAVFCSYVPPTGEEGTPRLRSNFEPVALWQASLESGADGRFCTEFTLPDTLTTYKVYALVLDASGESFGRAEAEFLVNQPLMLTAGTPFFMSQGDKLRLPLTITNNTDEAGEWDVSLSGAGEPAAQRVALKARRSATLYFAVEAREEGSCRLQWVARSTSGADAVEGSFPVRYPAPLLKEAHRLVLANGAADVATASLLAPEVAGATRGELTVACSTSPLIHLAGSVDFLLSYPYGCTEQRAGALLPWLFYEQLAPFCPQMALSGAEGARQVVTRSIEQILARQQEDGGLSYWKVPSGQSAASCTWASAYAALVLTLAQEQGFEVDAQALERLRNYLGRINWHGYGHLTQYAVARARGKGGEVNRILVRALRKELKEAKEWGFRKQTVDLEFMGELRSNPAGRHEALLRWLRSKGKDYRHRSSWSGGWTIIALAEYLRQEPANAGEASRGINGERQVVAARPTWVNFAVAAGQNLRDVAPTLSGAQGSVYVSVNVKAQPEQTDYPGVTEKGLQVTRLYEVKDANGQWRETQNFRVGDVVRVTLTCAKIADELEYVVLEDYLPSCMEAINPHVPGQAAGLEDGGWGRWSPWFDHKEYLADRVRGFCTRWAGRDVVNMSYYARVKRAGTSISAPAEAQLMYEPQTYGLSPNTRIESVAP